MILWKLNATQYHVFFLNTYDFKNEKRNFNTQVAETMGTHIIHITIIMTTTYKLYPSLCYI